MAAGSGGCQAGLPGEGGGEVAPAVHADLAVDGLGVVADGVGDRNRVAAMSSADRPPMIRAATSRSPGGEVPGAHEHAGEVGGGRGLDGDGVSAVDLGPDQRCHADQCPGAVGGLQLGLRRLVRLRGAGQAGEDGVDEARQRLGVPCGAGRLPEAASQQQHPRLADHDRSPQGHRPPAGQPTRSRTTRHAPRDRLARRWALRSAPGTTASARRAATQAARCRRLPLCADLLYAQVT